MDVDLSSTFLYVNSAVAFYHGPHMIGSPVLVAEETFERELRALHSALSDAVELDIPDDEKLLRIRTAGSEYTRRLKLDKLLQEVDASLSEFSVVFVSYGLGEYLALEFCTVGDQLFGQRHHVVRVPEQTAGIRSVSVGLEALLGPNLPECDWAERFHARGVQPVREGSRALFRDACQRECGLLLVAHGYRDVANEMKIKLANDADGSLSAYDMGDPPEVLLMLSCWSTLGDGRPMGYAMGSGGSHAIVASNSGAGHVFACMIDVVAESLARLVDVILDNRQDGLPGAYYRGREAFLKSSDLSPEDILAVVGFTYFMGASVAKIVDSPTEVCA